jgi:alkanesulfonate monooxygenase SsuD/methylene tetrahydromethanopterin reductase-like flavin-dependent oxidoreductase (luciferase family)
MRKIEFGWFTPAAGLAETAYVPLAISQQATTLPIVAAHFDSLWVQDHLYAFESPTVPFLECWTTLTWLAARFPSVRVGAIVLAVGFRHPALLAKMAATLQALSAGRCILAIGGGWREEEYRAYGYPFPSAAVRIKQLAEAVEILRRMWTEPEPTFQGRYFHIDRAYCVPRPDPLPPLMIGGGGEQLLLPLAARVADIWDLYHGNTYDRVDIAGYRRKRDIVRAHATAQGRDPASIVYSLTIGEARLPQSAAEARRWLDHLTSLVDEGVGQFILDCGHVPSTEPILRFAEEVIGPLNAGRA